MLTQYNLKMPHAVYGGENAMDNITAIVKALGAKKVAMFTDKGIEGAGLFALPKDAVKAAVQIFKRTASGAENLGNGNPGQRSNFHKVAPAARRGNWPSARGQRSVFCKGAATPAAKAGNRNQGISVTRMRAEMGSP